MDVSFGSILGLVFCIDVGSSIPEMGVVDCHGACVDSQGIETKRQWDLSEQLYGPQIRLAQWIEENLDPTESFVGGQCASMLATSRCFKLYIAFLV